MKKSFPATLDTLYSMLEFISEQVLTFGFDLSFLPKFELAAEEALVNIILYANMGPEGKIEIECVSADQGSIKIVIRDSGIPYNPIAHVKKVDLDTPIDEREPGGFGIFLMIELMDQVSYARVGDHNVLTLVKHLPVCERAKA